MCKFKINKKTCKTRQDNLLRYQKQAFSVSLNLEKYNFI